MVKIGPKQFIQTIYSKRPNYMFTKAIVRTPGKSLVRGLSTANLGQPDYKTALYQHVEYIAALERCGLDVMILPQEENYPDSTFVEDVALIAGDCAIITRPGAPSRRGETAAIKTVLKEIFNVVEEVSEPGTVEGGDIMKVGTHFYIGVSDRSNPEGARQVIASLEKYGFSGSVIKLNKMLHLKTGLAYLENNNLVVYGEMISKKEFREFNLLQIDPAESYAANCIWVNGTVLLPKGFPKTRAAIQGAGYPIIEVEVSEFQKLDGGLSCLSLRY
jgi:dimethylargininase